MDFEELENALFEDEGFLKFLPLLMEKNWKKAKPTQRTKIFEEIQRVVSHVDNKYPSVIKTEKLDEDSEEHIVFYDQYTMFDKILFSRTINPYDIVSNYFFELALCDLYERAKDDEFIETEKGKKIAVNCTSSVLDTFDNYFSRRSEDFFNQPIVHESAQISRDITFNLLKYMNNEYGMDNYIGSKVSNIMFNHFNSKKTEHKVEENYKKMLEKWKFMREN